MTKLGKDNRYINIHVILLKMYVTQFDQICLKGSSSFYIQVYYISKK